MKRIATIIGLLLGGLTFAAPAMAESYVITHGVWGYYQEYLRAIGSIRPGAFAVTTDGTGAFYVWCPDTQCVAGSSYRHKAVERCEREYGTNCVAFADRDDILVSYTFADAEPQPTSAPQLQPAPMTRLTLSGSAHATLDRYIKNSKSAGRAWALAVTKDGTKAVSADCPTTGGGGYFGDGGGSPGCDLTKGSAQELAELKAMKACGGSDDCILLYRGQQKVPSVEIVN